MTRCSISRGCSSPPCWRGWSARERTIGFPRAHLREPLAAFFYTTTADPGAASHVIDKTLGLLAPLGVVDRTVRFPIAVPRTAVAVSIAERFGPDGYALVNPGAAWPNKRWPPARFGALAAAIRREHGLRSIVLWGPGEEPLAAVGRRGIRRRRRTGAGDHDPRYRRDCARGAADGVGRHRTAAHRRRGGDAARRAVRADLPRAQRSLVAARRRAVARDDVLVPV